VSRAHEFPWNAATSVIIRQRLSTTMNHVLTGSTLALLAFSSSAHAQRATWTECRDVMDEFGRSVAFLGDRDGNGRDEVLIGAPGSGAGAVYVHSNWQAVLGDSAGDRFGAALAGRLKLDLDARPDALVGAPGDDDNGAECGSVTAFSGSLAKLYTRHGAAAGDGLGASVARVGDLDGDGYDEFLAGAPQVATGGAGYARLYSGLTGAVLRTHAGQAAGDRCGASVLGLGDWDGDGLPEYAVGSPREQGRGCVRVHRGSDGSVLQLYVGAALGDEFGYALGAHSDFDRDGFDELLVGIPRGGATQGEAVAYSGASGAELLRVGEGSASDRFGAALAGVGDFDGDGHGDWIVGAPGEDPSLAFPFGIGAATVFSGRDGSVLARTGGAVQGSMTGVAVAGRGDVDGNGVQEVVIGGLQNGDGYGTTACVFTLGRNDEQRVDLGVDDAALYGQSVAGLGDVDGDGRPEVLVGAPLARNGAGQSTGMARLLSADGQVLFTWFGSFAGDRFGRTVANAGDVDGDGVDDVFVGSAETRAPSAAPGVGYARVFSGANGSLLHHFQGPGAPWFGAALAGDADVDGDGRADLIVGGARVSLVDGTFPCDGHVRVYSGATGQVLHSFTGAPNQLEALGASVALLGDLDGDGRSEFAFGIPERNVGAPFFSVGEVEVRSGTSGALLRTLRSLYFRYGTTLARMGDLDGDGWEELCVSSWYADFPASEGACHMISGLDGSTLWSVDGQTPYSGPSFGYAIAAAGDHDGDGVADLLVGTPGTAQNHGRSIGSVELRSGIDGASLGYWSGYSGWDYFGYSLTGLGDVNGDGRPDVAIGAPTEPFNGVGANPGRNRVHMVVSNELLKYDHCRLSINTSGARANLSASGSSSLALNTLELTVDGATPWKAGLFRMGSNTASAPFANGHLCLSGIVTRLGAPVTLDAAGSVAKTVDLLGSHPGNLATAGSAWSFQFFFRQGAGLNTSDAVRVLFTP
jgi:hypothetical protein